jgi:HK97 family phage portal protein
MGTGQAGTYGQTINADTAMSIPAVWACVSLIAGTISSLPLQTFRRAPAGVAVKLPDGPLVSSPAPGMTFSGWVDQVMVSLLLRGNAYGMITERDDSFLPTQINLVNPDVLDVSYDDNGNLTYRVKRTRQLLPSEDVWHLAGLSMPGSKIGLSPISYAAATLGIDLSSRKFAGDFFDGGGIPKAVLSSDQAINQAQAHSVKDRFMSQFRAREPVVLGAGLSYTNISVSPEESQFLATMQANVAQVARYFGVPSDMIDGPSGTGMTYGNREQRSLDFLTYCILRWLRRIEDAFFVLLPPPVFARFDTRELLRTDADTAATVSLKYLAAKVVAPSEVREQLNLSPMTADQKVEADLVPLTITPTGGVKPVPGAMAAVGAASEAPVTDPTDPTEGVAA